MRSLLIGFLLLVMPVATAMAAPANVVQTDNAKATLISERQNISAGDKFYLALEMDLREHWHSYWINPGAAGLPTEIKWQLPPGLVAGDIMWPTPKAIYLGELVNYGYEGKTLYPIPFTATADFDASVPITITANTGWLVCKDICIPEVAILKLTLNQGAPEIPLNGKSIKNALAGLPPILPVEQLQGGFTVDGDQIRFSFIGGAVSNIKQGKKYLRFFPVDIGMVKHNDPQNPSFGEQGFTLWSKTGFRAKRDKLQSLDGVLVIGEGRSAKAWTVNLTENFAPDATGFDLAPDLRIAPKAIKGGLLLALLLAFVGGVLLNLMPCVFPVLSMKVMGFVTAAHEEAAKIKKHGLFFLVGVLASFLLLGGLLLALKAGGQQIGWGFQLQYPPFVAAIAVLFFVIGLNFLGLFQIGGQWTGIGSKLTKGNGNAGAFFTGVLAVIVASPCTAPAMGWAMGYTLTQSAPGSLLIFASLGLGFAAPFTLLSFYPALLRKLPKPGAWMQRFHQFMAFPMFGAAIWLVWVLGSLEGMIAIAAMLIAFLLIAFAFWSLKGKVFGKIMAGIAFVAAIIMVFNGFADRDVSGLEPQVWSPELVKNLQGEGKVVFVDFTAEWCVTCQFNKRTSLSGKKAAEVFAKYNAAFVVADWTARDDRIASELAKFGRVGVPLYLVYSPVNPEPMILPEILTPKIVEQALAKQREQESK